MQVDSVPDEHPGDRCWLRAKVKDTRPPLRHTSVKYGGRSDASDCSITFGGLTPKEHEAFTAFGNGESYLRVIDGRLHAYHAYEELPGPEDDPLLAPHWKTGEVKEFGGIPHGEGWHSPGIIITAVGAGSRYAGHCQKSQETLLECGFVCLRSPRGRDGTYWEQWVLHFMQAAKGPLRKRLDDWKKAVGTNVPWHAIAEEAALFITRDLDVAYGSLDITIQRWALISGD